MLVASVTQRRQQLARKKTATSMVVIAEALLMSDR